MTVEMIGREAQKSELSRFLYDFRRALLQHRRVRMKVFQRLYFPAAGDAPPDEGSLSAHMDFRTWLPADPPPDIRTNRLYRNLIVEQEHLIEQSHIALDGARQGRLTPETLANFLQTVQRFEQIADRVATGITTVMTDLDMLTGLLNRAALERDLAKEQAQSRRTGRVLTIAMIDADHFKEVNDRFGHGFGDSALETLSERFVASLRPRDQVYRYGGEEFLLLLPETPLDMAKPVLERLRLRAGEREISDGTARVTLTVSVGATEVRPDEDIRNAIDRADAALYRAKEAGRNRVELDTTRAKH